MTYRQRIMRMTRSAPWLAPVFMVALASQLMGADMPSEDRNPRVRGSMKESAAPARPVEKKDGGGVAIKIAPSMNFLAMELQDRKYKERSAVYLRDLELYTGAKISFMGLSLGGRAGVADATRPGRRRVDDFTVQAGYYSRPFCVEFTYQKAGRYRIVRSPFGIGGMWNGENRGAWMNNYGADLSLSLFMKDLLTLNRDYSCGAAHEQTEKPVKSAGSFIITIGADYNRVRGGAPITPDCSQLALLYLNLIGLKGWRFIGFTVGVGFAYTWALPHDLFISPVITLNIHPFQMELFTITGVKKDFRIDSMKGRGKITAGYDGGRFFAGLFVAFEAVVSPCYKYTFQVWTGDLNWGFFTGARI
jgi:hypothetical protein